jgi:signal transduction histidine kinase
LFLSFWRVTRLLVYTLFLAASYATASPLPQGEARVLVLHSYHAGQSWTESVMQGIREVFAPEAPAVLLHVEYLDTKRNPDPAYFDAFEALLRRKLTGLSFDLLLVSDNDALGLALRYRDELYPEIPIVFCGINHFTPEMLGGHKGITGVAEEPSYRETLELALSFHPQTREVIVIGRDDTLTERLILEDQAQALRALEGRVRPTFWMNLPAEELQARLPQLGKGQIVMLATTVRNQAGRVLSYGESCRLVRAACPVPLYGGWDFFLGKGIVGGRLVSGFRQGRLAAEMGLSILRGTEPATLPVVDTDANNAYMFDYSELSRFAIPDSALPEGALIINEPPSFYPVGKREFWIFLGLMVALAVLSLLLSRANYRLKQAKAGLRRALAEAEEERDRIDAILRSLADPLLLVDPCGRILQVNAVAKGLFSAAVAGRALAEVIDDPRFRELVEKTLKGDGEEGAVDLELYHPEYAAPRIFQTRLFPVAGQGRERAGAVAVLQDVTRLREMDRMKSDFISTAAHELRTPITVILGFCELLASGRDFSEEERQGFLQTIIGRAEGLSRLVNELLGLSRLERGGQVLLQPAECRFDELLLPLVEQYRALYPRHAFSLFLPTPAPRLNIDAAKISQVLDNLLSNAVKYSPEGGPVEVHVEAEAECCRLTVIDHGIGMSAQQSARMFEAFYRADFSNTAVGGLGLGMAIVRGIVEAHGGQIQVESVPGKGTKVMVSLPAARS